MNSLLLILGESYFTYGDLGLIGLLGSSAGIREYEGCFAVSDSVAKSVVGIFCRESGEVNGNVGGETAECVFRNVIFHGSDGDLSKTCASCEYVIADLCLLAADGDLAGETGASCECFVIDGNNVRKELYISERGTILERLCADTECFALAACKYECGKLRAVLKHANGESANK